MAHISSLRQAAQRLRAVDHPRRARRPDSFGEFGPLTTASPAVVEADQAKVAEIFAGLNAGWSAGRAEGPAFGVAHTYPGLAQTLDACDAATSAGRRQRYDKDLSTFTPADPA